MIQFILFIKKQKKKEQTNNNEYLRATMTVVNSEEMHRRDLVGSRRTRRRTSADAIARPRHEPRHDGDGILHLPPAADHRLGAPGQALVAPPHALPPRRRLRRRWSLAAGRAGESRLRDPRGRNLAGAGAGHRRVAGARREVGARGGELEVEVGGGGGGGG